jgi:hypothetical protein
MCIKFPTKGAERAFEEIIAKISIFDLKHTHTHTHTHYRSVVLRSSMNPKCKKQRKTVSGSL